MKGGMKNWRFSTNISLYLGNPIIIYGHSYNGSRIASATLNKSRYGISGRTIISLLGQLTKTK